MISCAHLGLIRNLFLIENAVLDFDDKIDRQTLNQRCSDDCLCVACELEILSLIAKFSKFIFYASIAVKITMLRCDEGVFIEYHIHWLIAKHAQCS